ITARPGTTMTDVVRELEERAESQAAPVVDGVTLASVHAAKGLEWPVVFVVGASDGLLPISMATTPAEIEEERRLFYVALTRARDLLTVTWSAARTPGARGSRRASRFLDQVLTHPDSPRTAPGAGPRRTGRRSATVYAECRVCGQGLVSPRDQRRGRPEGRPSSGRELLTVTWSAARTPGARGSRRASRFLDQVLTHPDSPRTAPGAGPRRTGRRSATVYAECRVCGQGLVSPRDQRRGRHEGCP